jgi:signal transduction histidine kinase
LTRARDDDGTSIAILFAVINHLLYAMMSLAWWAAWSGQITATTSEHTRDIVRDGLAVVLVNVLFGLLVIGGTFVLRPMRRPWRTRLLIITGVALVASVPRALQAIPSTPTSGTYLVVEYTASVVAAIVAVGAGLLVATLMGMTRSEERRRVAGEIRARQAVDQLQAEETRVRRMVSDQLHGRLQYRMVVVTAGLDGVADQLSAAGDDARAAELRRLVEALEQIREDEVRSLSQAVFPSGADLSTAAAIDVLLRRLPREISASIELGPGYGTLVDRNASPMPVPERLVAIYTVEEAVTNALKHGHARSVVVRADAAPTAVPGRWLFEATIDDDGTGPPAQTPQLHGLERHRSRIESRGGALELTRNPKGGARLRFTLPFEPALDDAAS